MKAISSEGLHTGQAANPTAGILVIGDEILSGRTADTNINYIAKFLDELSISLQEVRIVADEEAAIVEAINTLRQRFTYVFTTGGIGPTHDDITADSIAKAFSLPLEYNREAEDLLLTFYGKDKFTDARRRMARIPKGGKLIDNPISRAPGFRLENVFVMAGVPRIMQAMLQNIRGTLATGKILQKRTFSVLGIGESSYSEALSNIAKKYPSAKIGSYPGMKDGKLSNQITVRGDGEDFERACIDITCLIDDLNSGNVSNLASDIRPENHKR